MKTTNTEQEQPGKTTLALETAPAPGHRSDLQDWAAFWPIEADSPAQSEAFLREVLAGLGQPSVQDRLAGYRSETQGQ